MNLEINKENKETIMISMIGKFNIEDEHKFQVELNKVLKGKTKRIFFNFSKLTHIDSTGVGSMIRIMNMAKSSDVEIYLYSIPGNI